MDQKEELIQIVRLVQKDMGKFALLYTKVINKVYYWCYCVVNDEVTAKNIAQECMVNIYQKLHTLDNAEMFCSWMYRLVSNSCYVYLQNQRSNRLCSVYGNGGKYA